MVPLRVYRYFRQVDSFELDGTPYVLSKSHGEPFGCLGQVCDYELGEFSSMGIAEGADEVFRVCRPKQGFQSKYECWMGGDAAVALARRIRRSSLPTRQKAELAIRTAYFYDEKAIGEARRRVSRMSRDRFQRGSITWNRLAQVGPNGEALDSTNFTTSFAGNPVYQSPVTGNLIAQDPSGQWRSIPPDALPNDFTEG